LPFVECDPALMEVVFTNLLSNAVKDTRPRPQAVIEVGSTEEEGAPASPSRLESLQPSHPLEKGPSMPDEHVEILLVEDNVDDVELAVLALRREKLAKEIAVARDGEEALDFIFCRGLHAGRTFQKPPRLVLLDPKLPKVSGLDIRVAPAPVVGAFGRGAESVRPGPPRIQPGATSQPIRTGDIRADAVDALS